MRIHKVAAVDVSTLSKKEVFLSLILIGTLFFVFGLLKRCYWYLIIYAVKCHK